MGVRNTVISEAIAKGQSVKQIQDRLTNESEEANKIKKIPLKTAVKIAL